MRKSIWIFLLCGCAMAGEVHLHQSGFAPDAPGWTPWSHRAETAPRAFVEPAISLGEAGSLAVSGNGNVGEFGGWQRVIPNIRAGAWYRFTASYRTSGITSENWQVLPRIDWRSVAGKRSLDHVEYAAQSQRQGIWTKVSLETQARPGSSVAVLQLFLAHAPSGMVWWDDIVFEEIPAPTPRPVTIATINLRPQSTKASAESVRQFLEMADRSVPAGTDMILLPEGITVIGTGKSYAEVSEPIPGPATERLSALARRKKAYVVAGLYERDGAVVYNTSVLLDREGSLIGRYRKVHLPQNEMEELTPGNDYPVFRTDFGTVGMIICYDVYFADPARALAAQGAEIILMPIWGGPEALAAARAIENHVYLVASGYDHPTYIMGPDGKRLAEAERGSVAIAKVDLASRRRDDKRPREYRPDVRVDYLPSGNE